jgi:hypothetical protein
MGSRKWKGKRGALFKGKGKRKPKGRPEPEKERGDHSAIDTERGDIGLANAAPPNTSLTSTNRARIRGKVNMSPTSSLSLKLRSMMT